MKVTVNLCTRPRVSSKTMKLGQIGRIHAPNSPYDGEVVIAVYENLASLTNPHNTWSNWVDHEVEIFPAGSQVTLEVE